MVSEKEKVQEYLEDVAGKLFIRCDYPSYDDYQEYASLHLAKCINTALEDAAYYVEDDYTDEDYQTDIEELRYIFLDKFFSAVFQTACDVENASKKIKTFKKAREFLIKTVDKLNAKFVKVIDRDIATPAITHAGLEMLNDCISYIMDLMNL